MAGIRIEKNKIIISVKNTSTKSKVDLLNGKSIK